MRLGPVATVHVAVPEGRTVAPRRLAAGPDVTVRVVPHQVRDLQRLLLPAGHPPRLRVPPAVLHSAAWAASDRAAEWRVAAAVQQRLVRPTDLRAQLSQMPGLRRRGLLTAVLDDVEQGAHAASELEFLRFLRRAGLPAPDRLQRPVRTNGLRYLDAWWERQRVAVELDGAHHRFVAEWEADVLRANEVVVAERRSRVLMLRFTTGNLRHDGPQVAAQLSAVLT